MRQLHQCAVEGHRHHAQRRVGYHRADRARERGMAAVAREGGRGGHGRGSQHEGYKWEDHSAGVGSGGSLGRMFEPESSGEERVD